MTTSTMPTTLPTGIPTGAEPSPDFLELGLPEGDLSTLEEMPP